MILKDGRIEQAGPPLDVYDRPANLFVAGFIGSPAMNILSGTVESEGAGASLRVGEARVTLPVRAAAFAGRKVACGVRPEHLQPVSEATGLTGTVATVEPTGPETHVYVKLGGREVCAITAERLPLKPGAPVHLAADPARLHLFDQATGLRL